MNNSSERNYMIIYKDNKNAVEKNQYLFNF